MAPSQTDPCPTWRRCTSLWATPFSGLASGQCPLLPTPLSDPGSPVPENPHPHSLAGDLEPPPRTAADSATECSLLACVKKTHAGTQFQENRFITLALVQDSENEQVPCLYYIYILYAVCFTSYNFMQILRKSILFYGKDYSILGKNLFYNF